MPTTPFQLVSSSSLSSDFLASNQVLVDATSRTPVSVFRNPLKNGAIEALAITSALGTDSQLCYLGQDASVATGWQLSGLTSQWGAVTASEVVAFATTWNTVEAYFIGLDGSLYHLTMDTGGAAWSVPQAVDGAPAGLTALNVTYPLGQVLVAAVASDGSVFMAQSSDGSWDTGTSEPFLPPNIASMAMALAGASFTVWYIGRWSLVRTAHDRIWDRLRGGGRQWDSPRRSRARRDHDDARRRGQRRRPGRHGHRYHLGRLGL